MWVVTIPRSVWQWEGRGNRALTTIFASAAQVMVASWTLGNSICTLHDPGRLEICSDGHFAGRDGVTKKSPNSEADLPSDCPWTPSPLSFLISKPNVTASLKNHQKWWRCVYRDMLLDRPHLFFPQRVDTREVYKSSPRLMALLAFFCCRREAYGMLRSRVLSCREA
jgi:hypothetical protein